MCFIFKVHTHLSGTSVSLFIHTFLFSYFYFHFFLDFLTRRILITIYNILTYLSGIKIAYDNNKDNNINNNSNNKTE